VTVMMIYYEGTHFVYLVKESSYLLLKKGCMYYLSEL
jgi:hypothetical protein